MYKRDGHIHSPFCPHGTQDPLSDYIERAIELGFKELTFTEHAPLPTGFVDTTPTKDSSMSLEKLPKYLEEVQKAKVAFSSKIKINIGLEVDYIEGYEEEIKSFLNDWGRYLDDSILSVHFLKFQNKYDCLDYSPEAFGEMIERYGSVEAIYSRYFETLKQSIQANLGTYKPKRIGHMTLVHKFQKKYPVTMDFTPFAMEILQEIKENNYELDYNGAGLFKAYCKEPYPPSSIIKEARRLQIPLVYGSDAHQAKDISQGWNELF